MSALVSVLVKVLATLVLLFSLGQTGHISHPLYGDLPQTHYFYISAHIGTPGQLQRLMLDTSTPKTIFPCDLCETQNCSSHYDAAYDHKKSTSSTTVPCETCSEICDTTRNACGFEIELYDGPVSGVYIQDLIQLERVNSELNESESITFGCNFNENKTLRNLQVDGILGLGFGGSIMNDLIENEHRAFSICFGDQGGSLDFGMNDSISGEMKTVPFEDEGYEIELNKLQFGDKGVEIQKNLPIHSADPYMRLKFETYAIIVNQIKDICEERECDSKIEEVEDQPDALCFTKEGSDALFSVLPSLIFGLNDDLEYEVSPKDLFSGPTKSSTAMCLAIVPTTDSQPNEYLGSVFLKNHYAIFDFQNRQFSFIPMICESHVDKATHQNVIKDIKESHGEPIYDPEDFGHKVNRAKQDFDNSDLEKKEEQQHQQRDEEEDLEEDEETEDRSVPKEEEETSDSAKIGSKTKTSSSSGDDEEEIFLIAGLIFACLLLVFALYLCYRKFRPLPDPYLSGRASKLDEHSHNEFQNDTDGPNGDIYVIDENEVQIEET
eukprot:CAMPEP_0115029544 /NCGR_PEP_ID=MMETSP0216-20121206/37078_1 /TAXON_ID=223996 /ORGANISM="Protocruzia adherens, Strain Boccale" /LENGTH=549 /DNA_ID=CAMNT_0002406177 /DNA_START=61 /DNA_END=1710 /DNA_ORIENTATION=-